MRPGIAISLALDSLHKERQTNEIGFRRDVVERIKHLVSNRVPIAGIRIRPGIEGDYSDEVSDFIGRLAIAGYVIQESPIKLTPKGVQLIEQSIEEHREDPDVVRAAALLGVPLT